MAKSDQWLQVKRILGQASVVLEEISMKLREQGKEKSDHAQKVKNAQQSVSETLKDEVSLQQSAELLEYDELVKKLKAQDMEFTHDELKRAREL